VGIARKKGRSEDRPVRVRQWYLPANQRITQGFVLSFICEQSQNSWAVVSTPAKGVPDILNGQGTDREAPARLTRAGIDRHGVASARHEAVSL